MTEEERREMTRSNYARQMEMLGYDASGNPLDRLRKDEWKRIENVVDIPKTAKGQMVECVEVAPIVRCRNCKYCFSINYDPLKPYNGESDWYCEQFDRDWNVHALDPNRFYCANGDRREECDPV